MADKQRIMILGAGVMQGPAIRIAREMGLFAIVLDGNPNAPCVPLADRFEPIDLADKEAIAALAVKLKAEPQGLCGIFTAGTDFSASVAYAAARASLPGIPHETALDASDKERMRQRFKAAGVPSPEFFIFSGGGSPPLASKPSVFRLPPQRGSAPQRPADSSDHSNDHSLRSLVVKPVDNMGGRGCRMVNTQPELEAAIADAVRFSRSGRVIIEEYMDGPEYSIDAIVCDGEITICGIADRHIFFPPYFIEMGHTIPSELSGEKLAALVETFKAGVRSLGITRGAAKGDVKLTSKGPMIGEIAARLSGGYMSGWTYPYASGASPTKAGILAAIGAGKDDIAAALAPQKDWVSAERAFISIPGTINAIKFKDRAENIQYVKDLFFRIEVGSKVMFPENNVSKCGNIISAAPTRQEAAASAESAVRAILLGLKPGDPDTEAFLAGYTPLETLAAPESGAPSMFPPDAFAVGAEIKTCAEALPLGLISSGDNLANLAIAPFPAFAESSICDYVGRNVAESLAAARELTGLALPIAGKTEQAAFGKEFWRAMMRGGYQGAAYFVETRLQSGKTALNKAGQ